MTKVNIEMVDTASEIITDSHTREGAISELENAGIDASGVSKLGYDSEADAEVPLSMRKKSIRGNGSRKIRELNDGIDIRAPKPDWLRVRAPQSPEYFKLRDEVNTRGLKTVCQEAACPNIGDCWSSGHLTTMIMGDTCTRGCAFCNIKTGKPMGLNADEPAELANIAQNLSIKHMVITSVDRDDLVDGGAAHWAACVTALREAKPDMTLEILTPDFRRKPVDCIDMVSDALPDVYNHNIETVPRLYREICPGSRYFGSLSLLKRVKDRHPNMFTKSGIMVGMGEKREEVLQVMDDLRDAGVDFITIGQYLRPSMAHYPVREYITPEQFADYEQQAKNRGFLQVACGPLVRSSFHADKFFEELVAKRKEENAAKNTL